MDEIKIEDISYYLLHTNASELKDYGNVYFLGPLGSFVWLPFVIILSFFFLFFTYSFIVFHAKNRDKYEARRNRMILERYTYDQIVNTYSHSNKLTEILPKRKLRAFPLKMNLENVLRDIWRCHGANPRKLQARIMQQMQLQMEMLQASKDCPDLETKSLPSSEALAAGCAFPAEHFTAGQNPQRGRGQLLASTPPLSRTPLPILQKSDSVTVTGQRRSYKPSHLPTISGGMGGNFTSIRGQSLLPLSMLPRLDFYPSTYDSASYPSPSDMDLECDNDFISEGRASKAKSSSEDKKAKSVFMMQKFYKR